MLDDSTKTIHKAVGELASRRIGLSTDDLLCYEPLFVLLFPVLENQIIVERVASINILVCLEQLELTLECAREIAQQIEVSTLLELEAEQLVTSLSLLLRGCTTGMGKNTQ